VKKKITVLVTDLDNTLYDWFAMWYAGFRSMLDALVAETGISEDQLIGEIKAVHERRGTSEYAFLLQELPSLLKVAPAGEIPKRFDHVIHAYNSGRKHALELYPGVLETLTAIKRSGCLIVGYTESLGFYTLRRVITLELDGLFDYLYSPPDHELPEGTRIENIRRYSAGQYSLQHAQHRTTPEGEKKPNPHILGSLISEVGGTIENTAYVGDSLTKDVAMAQAINVFDMWAKYGESHKRAEYELLRRVTHWTPEAVAAEKAKTAEEVMPTTVLNEGFYEILDHVEPHKKVS
jgi:phosphoglycolate phosphatase-like HAD superfamily hydrolase